MLSGVGGPTGDWSDPRIGSVEQFRSGKRGECDYSQGWTPNFDSSVSGPVSIDSLTGGSLQMGGGALFVSNDVNLNQFNQTGGSVSVGGNLVFDSASNRR